MRKKIKIQVLIPVLFIVSLYYVESSPFSANEVAKYNAGYGTFDMKSYDTTTVARSLKVMEPEGFTKYDQYLFCDTIFIFTFGALGLLLCYYTYHNVTKNRILLSLIYVVPVLRGICDLTENTALYKILHTYPTIHPSWIHLSSMATQIKLKLIGVWVVLLLVGFALTLWKRLKHQ